VNARETEKKEVKKMSYILGLKVDKEMPPVIHCEIPELNLFGKWVVGRKTGLPYMHENKVLVQDYVCAVEKMPKKVGAHE
jgi:hypothetical protein